MAAMTAMITVAATMMSNVSVGTPSRVTGATGVGEGTIVGAVVGVAEVAGVEVVGGVVVGSAEGSVSIAIEVTAVEA